MAKQPVTVELWYDGAWHSATAYARDPIKITRGSGSEGSEAPPSNITLTFDNRDGSKNPRNPSSPLYGKVGRNTPLRVVHGADIRATGEVSSWKPRHSLGFDRAAGRGDAWTEVTASGITRRLGQGADVLVSPLRRAYGSNTPVAYWPLEDDAQSAAASSAMPAGRAATVTDVTFGPDDTLPASAGVATFSATSSLSGTVAPYAAAPALSMVLLFKLPAMPAGPVLLAQWRATGTVKRWELSVDPVGYYLDGFPADPEAAAIYHRATGFGVGAEPTNWIAMHVGLLNNGANVDVSWLWTAVGSGTFYSASTTGSYAGTCGRAQAFLILASAGLDGAKFTHVMLTAAALPFVTSAFDRAASAYDGEAAGTRFLRLCSEEGIAGTVVGTSTDTQPMGPQRLDTLLNLLAEVERTDDGMLYEPRTSRGVVFRTGRSRYNQTAALTLDYDGGDLAPPLDPDVDDLGTRNDVTAKRPKGGTARAVRESGPLNVQDPEDDPDGVGRVTTQVDVNTVNDGALPNQAYWHLNKGTVPDTRYPQITVDLVASPGLATAAAAVDIGDRITITNIPDQPDPADLIVLGIQPEIIESHQRRITYVCVPETPFRIGVYDATSSRYDSASSTLSAGVTTTATSWSVATSSGPLWTTRAGAFPFDLLVEGERVTVTNITGAASPQTFTVTRSVNGVVKAHAAGAPVRLFRPVRYAL